MTLVVDASVALKWVCAEADSEQAALLLARDDLVAPAFWLVEAANVLWRRTESGELTNEEAEERVSELLEAPVAGLSVEPFLAVALRLAARLHHPVYDCLYLAVAQSRACQLITADRRLSRIAAAHEETAGIVRLLGA